MAHERLKNTVLKTASFLLSGALSFGCTPTNSDPTLPNGFSRVDCSEAKVSMAKPDNWHFKEESSGSTRACFVTKEEIQPGKLFDTGFSLNMIPNASQRFRKRPSQVAEEYINNPPLVLIKPTGEASCITEGDIRSCTRNFTIGDRKDYLLKISGNDGTDKFYLMWF